MRLLGAGDVREIAGALGVRPTKKLGQNFVVEQGTVRQIAAIAGPRAGDVVLEVGPGLGSLTLALLELAAGADARLVAVEIDPVLAKALPETIAARAPDAAARVTVVPADALRVSAADLRARPLPDTGADAVPPAPAAAGTVPPAAGTVPADVGADGSGAPTVLAANLPYNVAVPVVLRLLETLPTLERGVVMVQAEVADRMCAPPGGRVYGAPSAKIAWYATARHAGTVPRSVFWPVPNVDSKLVSFQRHEALGSEANRRETFRVIDAAFGQRRKTLRAALAGWAGSAAEAEKLLRAAGVDPSARGESLSIAKFARIAAERRPPQDAG